ncbi:MAG: SDR family oxidoreductase [Clostridia bacterium]|nr:SDR family oxidoreductase [Clostridia bacterium]
MNKVALITGSTRGIGKAIAREFAKKGYDIIINYINSREKAEELKQQIEEMYNVKVLAIQANLENEIEIKNMVNKAIKEFEEKTVEDWKKTLDVNLIAPFVLTKLVGKEMMQQKGGVIVNISSTNGINTYYPSSAEYDASKAGLISLTYDSAVEYAPYVRVNCVAPGWVNTEMNKELSDDFVKGETERILVKRFGEPEEIAKVVTFLASEDASFINSEVIKADGGWY